MMAKQKHGVLTRLSLLCFRRPLWSLLFALITVGLSLGLTYARLDLELDWLYLFSPSDPYVQRVKQHRLDFPAPRDIAVLVEGSKPEHRHAFLDLLADHLEAEPEYFQHVFHRLDLSFVRSTALYYLSLDDLKNLLAEFEFVLPYLRVYSETGHLEACLQQFLRDLKDYKKKPDRASMALRLGDQMLLELEASLESRGRNEIGQRLKEKLLHGAPGETEAILRGETTFYNSVLKGEVHLLLVKPTGPRESLPHATASVTRLREIIDQLRPKFHGLQVRLGGAPVLRADERTTCGRDSLQATLVSVLLVTVLYGLAFMGELRRPATAVVTLLVGLSWTLGFTTLAIGHLNFITVSLMAILAGLGIDFGIHVSFRYFEERRNREPAEALAVTIAGTGADTSAGAIATAAAFAVMGPAGFRGIGELGLLAGGGVLLCYLATITVLPACLGLNERRAVQPPPPAQASWRRPFEQTLLANRRVVVVVALIFSLWCANRVSTVGFDYNLLRMQDPTLESIRTEIRMSQQGNSTVIPAISVADDVEQARERCAAFEQLPTVARAYSLAQLVPPNQELKTPLVHRFLEGASGIELQTRAPEVGAARLLRLAGSLGSLERALSNMETSLARGGDPKLVDELGTFRDSLGRVKGLVDKLGPGSVEDGLLAVEKALTGDLGAGFSLLKEQKAEPATVADLPELLRVRFLGKDDQLAVMVFAKEDLWEREPLERLNADLDGVDPDIMGEPTLMLHFGDVVVGSHKVIGWYAFGAVILVLGIHLHSLRILLLALLPTTLSILWLHGFMSLTGESFSAANFIAIPMLVGIGCIFGVHVIHRILEEGRPSVLTLSTGPAVLLSALTTMAGFGSLMTVHHRGMVSLGFIITVGVAANLVASLILLPCLSYKGENQQTE